MVELVQTLSLKARNLCFRFPHVYVVPVGPRGLTNDVLWSGENVHLIASCTLVAAETLSIQIGFFVWVYIIFVLFRCGGTVQVLTLKP